MKLNWEEFQTVVIKNLQAGQRIGQAEFNALHQIAPDEADKIRGTELDPFYSDFVRYAFLAHILPLFEDIHE